MYVIPLFEPYLTESPCSNGMGKINIVISDSIEKLFRDTIGSYKGVKKGSISEAMNEAIEMWIESKSSSNTNRGSG